MAYFTKNKKHGLSRQKLNALSWLNKTLLLIFPLVSWAAASSRGSPRMSRLTYMQLDWTSSIIRQKNNLPTNQKGDDNSETTAGKFLARRIQICLVCFCKIYFWPLNFWNKWKHGPNKNILDRIGFTSLNTLVPRDQILLGCLGSMTKYFLVS